MVTALLLAAGVLLGGGALVTAQPCYFSRTLIDSNTFTNSGGFSQFSLSSSVLTGHGWALGPYGNPSVASSAQWTGLPLYDCYSVSLTYWALDSWDVASGDTASVVVNGATVFSATRSLYTSCQDDPVFTPWGGSFPNPWSGDSHLHKCFVDVSHEDTLNSPSSSFLLTIRGDINQGIEDESWAATRVVVTVGTTEPPPALVAHPAETVSVVSADGTASALTLGSVELRCGPASDALHSPVAVIVDGVDIVAELRALGATSAGIALPDHSSGDVSRVAILGDDRALALGPHRVYRASAGPVHVVGPLIVKGYDVVEWIRVMSLGPEATTAPATTTVADVAVGLDVVGAESGSSLVLCADAATPVELATTSGGGALSLNVDLVVDGTSIVDSIEQFTL